MNETNKAMIIESLRLIRDGFVNRSSQMNSNDKDNPNLVNLLVTTEKLTTLIHQLQTTLKGQTK